MVISVDSPAAAHTCPAADLIVMADDVDAARLVCEGGEDAFAFLSGLGLEVPPGLVIEVLDHLPALYGVAQLGTFDANTGRIQVLAYSCAQSAGQNGLLFGQPLSPDLYRGIVAHEVAHALFDANFSGRRSRIVPQEYIAYVTQFVAMSPQLRTRILQASPVGAFEDESCMSEMRYFLNPQAFAIASYRHFVGLPDGRAFVWRLLRGEARLPPPWGR